MKSSVDIQGILQLAISANILLKDCSWQEKFGLTKVYKYSTDTQKILEINNGCIAFKNPCTLQENYLILTEIRGEMRVFL